MAKKIIDTDEVKKTMEYIYRKFYDGDPEPWFSYLCGRSVYIGGGETMLFGNDIIKGHFSVFTGTKCKVLSYESFAVRLSDDTAQIYGKIKAGTSKYADIVVTTFTCIWQLIGGEMKLVYQHMPHEYLQSNNPVNSKTITLDVNTRQFVQSLMVYSQHKDRIIVKSGCQTLYVDPNSILYAESQRKKTKLVCVDREISCNIQFKEMLTMLPEEFYQIHRCYVINTRYVTAVRRFEVELISDIKIPVPELSYTQVREKLNSILKMKK
ncbi:MAG: LytR/AlgR family response regulator transcription factor [Candidatus Ornithomonoglobus sp.]